MANENKNTNELVSTEDDATAELQQLTLQQVLAQSVPEPELEVDADTFSFDRLPGRPDNVELLNADLDSRAERIEGLQFDLEQVRARFNGLQSEVRAREEITNDLMRELAGLQEQLSTRGRQLSKRDRVIKELKAEIRERESLHHDCVGELETASDDNERLQSELMAIQDELVALSQSQAAAEPDPAADGADATLAASEAQADELRSQLNRTEAYADSLRKQLADQTESNAEFEQQLGHTRLELVETQTLREQLEAQVRTQGSDNLALVDQVAVMQARHNEEIRVLRETLGAAQDVEATREAEALQLAAELEDARQNRDELERLFEAANRKHRTRIEGLEADLARVTELNTGNEAKLATKTDALNALLAEFSNPVAHPKQKPLEEAPPAASKDRERVNRMLIGRIDDQEIRFPLFKNRLTIGRTRDNDLHLNVPYISRRHAVLLTEGDTTRVVDWGSKNGVYVNSSRVTEHFLTSGDRVTIGNAEFRYEERPRRDV